MTTILNEIHTFSYPEDHEGTLAPNIVTESAGFNGRIAFDCRTRLAANEAVTSAVGAIAPTGPTIGAIDYSGDRLTVLVPVSTLTTETDYTLTITVTSTNGDVFELNGTIKVE